jgi:hypothetical protein
MSSTKQRGADGGGTKQRRRSKNERLQQALHRPQADFHKRTARPGARVIFRTAGGPLKDRETDPRDQCPPLALSGHDFDADMSAFRRKAE